MIRRQLHSLAFSETWGRQMRFIVGPRQTGKTTLPDHPVDEQHLVHAAALGHVLLVQVCAAPGIAVRQRQGVFRLSATRLFAG